MDGSPYVAGGRDIDQRSTAKRRSDLRRLRRRLEEKGAVTLEGAAWKNACGTSILACAAGHPRARDFLAA